MDEKSRLACGELTQLDVLNRWTSFNNSAEFFNDRKTGQLRSGIAFSDNFYSIVIQFLEGEIPREFLEDWFVTARFQGWVGKLSFLDTMLLYGPSSYPTAIVQWAVPTMDHDSRAATIKSKVSELLTMRQNLVKALRAG